MEKARTVVIVGAGFSGVVTAVHLLRSGIGMPLRVILMNRSGWMARGVAYGTRVSTHLLNVPAGRMSAFADDEDSFLRFVRTRDASLTGGTFVSRTLYGDYLEQILADAAGDAAPGTTLLQLRTEVKEIHRDASGERRAEVVTAEGETILADRVVLALGNFAPADPPAEDRSFYQHARYIRDPWIPNALQAIGSDASVLLIGASLTMVDMALALRSQGVRGKLYAISRRGLLPQAHRSPSVPPAADHCPPGIDQGPYTARAYLHAVRRHVKTLAAQGVDWREVIGSLRSLTPRLWQALDIPERARFLRHVRPYWEVHRHRMAPAAAEALQEMLGTDALEVLAGRVQRFTPGEEGVEVTFRRRGSDLRETLKVSHVINCTGPGSDMRSLDDPLIRYLREQGVLRPDPLGLGVETDTCGALLDREGNASDLLYYVGPLLKAHYWESTAAPELRIHAARLAGELIDSLRGT
ncbi:MAG TPA: FAD/NAD(P)-binding protein [Chthonomonadaceae bacterium]|nr:FAD/NAD(P)-binding protein [Chthonomonadaceae bacterium]